MTCLSLYGESGLKFFVFKVSKVKLKSLSVWREWIEMLTHIMAQTPQAGLSLYGESGLKFLRTRDGSGARQSLSVWREWIEIACGNLAFNLSRVSLCMERVD